MPPPRRSRRLAAAATATAPAAESRSKRARRRLSVRRGVAFKREGRRGAAADADDDDDGLPLSDEALLAVFSALSGATADLVRCAATCRRWRRLVSADAAFICRGATPRSDPFIRGLALGFFHSRTDGGGRGGEPAPPPRFVPFSAAASRHQPSLAALVGGASRVVASRNGRLVLDLRRRARARTTHAVRLGVCNPVAGGGVDVLPPLRGKDSPTGPYACTVLTATDELHHDGGSVDRLVSQHSAYRVLLLYNRRSFTALRCYSSDMGTWGPEAEVTGARIGRSQPVGQLHAAVVHDGVVFWPRLAVALRLDALRHPAAVAAPKNGRPHYAVAGLSSPRRRHPGPKTKLERLLGVMPDGRMLRVEADSETIRAYCGGDTGGGDVGEWSLGGALRWKWTMKLALMRLHTVRLRWLCERSGVVIFTAGDGSGPGTHVYTVDVETMQFARVAAGGEPPIGEEVCGYEMDRVTLLASLGRTVKEASTSLATVSTCSVRQ